MLHTNTTRSLILLLVSSGLAIAWSQPIEAQHQPTKQQSAKDRSAKNPGDQPAKVPAKVKLVVPEDLMGGPVDERRTQQLATADRLQVMHDFTFSDRVDASGITFEHQIVDDAGKYYRAVHYDHGNGLAAGDVDGDGLVDLYFVSQLGRNELWRATGNGRYEDITQRAGVGVEDRVSVSASFADVDNDGDPDLFVTTVRHGNVFFRNRGDGHFDDATKEAGLEYSGHSSGALFFDYDADGWLDLFLVNLGKYTSDTVGRGGYYVGIDQAFFAYQKANHSEASVLYRNRGDGTFEDVSKKTLLQDVSWSGDAIAADFTGDPLPDLYVLNMHGPDSLWENVGGEFFVERTDKYFKATPPGSMGVKVFDWNHDGSFDLILTDMHADMAENIGYEREKLKAEKPPSVPVEEAKQFIFGNALFERTEDGGGFHDVSQAAGVENYWPWGLSVDDLNADGWDDAFLTSSMNYPFRYGFNSLLLNNRGQKFIDSEFILGVEPRASGNSLPWFDLDCSPQAQAASQGEGSADPKAEWKVFKGEVADTEMNDKGHHLCEGQSGLVEVWGAKGSRSSVMIDIDDDGDLDIVTSEFGDRPQILVSNLADKHPVQFLKVRLRGAASNRSGVGAVVKVTAGDHSQLKLNDGKSGYLAQSDIPLYFGLGAAKKIDSVEVTWPSGQRQVVKAPKVNTLLVIDEPTQKPSQGSTQETEGASD